jgi:hypothetical protein
MIGWELWEHTADTGGTTPGLFTVSPYWTTNSTTATSAKCSNLVLYGPMAANQWLNYSKPLPAHNFIVI